MTKSYTITIPTDKDWVRLQTGDTDYLADGVTENFELHDEEIQSLLDEAANKWYAAATVLCILRARWGSQGRGLLQKKVEDLDLKWGADSSADTALQARIDWLRSEGAHELSPAPSVFRVLSPT